MQTKIPASIADQGRVRLGAGIRSAARVGRVAATRTETAPAKAPAIRVPASVADTGRVRLGAGIRRG